MENQPAPSPNGNEKLNLEDLANLPLDEAIPLLEKRLGLKPLYNTGEESLEEKVRRLPKEEALKLLKENFENSSNPHFQRKAQSPNSLRAIYGSIMTYEW